jgi:hypothetical protein
MPANKTIEVTGVWRTECVPMSVSWQSGSHYSTIQALEPYLPADKGIRSLSSGHESSPPIPAPRRCSGDPIHQRRSILLVLALKAH